MEAQKGKCSEESTDVDVANALEAIKEALKTIDRHANLSIRQASFSQAYSAVAACSAEDPRIVVSNSVVPSADRQMGLVAILQSRAKPQHLTRIVRLGRAPAHSKWVCPLHTGIQTNHSRKRLSDITSHLRKDHNFSDMEVKKVFDIDRAIERGNLFEHFGPCTEDQARDNGWNLRSFSVTRGSAKRPKTNEESQNTVPEGSGSFVNVPDPEDTSTPPYGRSYPLAEHSAFTIDPCLTRRSEQALPVGHQHTLSNIGQSFLRADATWEDPNQFDLCNQNEPTNSGVESSNVSQDPASSTMRELGGHFGDETINAPSNSFLEGVELVNVPQRLDVLAHRSTLHGQSADTAIDYIFDFYR